MSNLLQTFEKKLTECEAQLKTQSQYVNEIAAAVEKLLLDKANATSNISILNGAIQAYTDAIKVINEPQGNE
jgi:hypothetical protein